MPEVEAIIAELRALARPEAIEGMRRFGIDVQKGFGLKVPQLRALARRLGRNQQLAEQLWQTGLHDARILATFVALSSQLSGGKM